MLDPSEAQLHDWLGLATSAVLSAGYELRLRSLARRAPERIARLAHARLRREWVLALAKQPGTELLAVQTLRNSLMSATILASTSALALMGVVSLLARGTEANVGDGIAVTPRVVVLALLLGALFVSHVVAAISIRFFNHAGFMVSLPVASPLRASVTPRCVEYLERAGRLYSVSIRVFFYLVPLAIGLFSPAWMPLPTAAMLVALTAFDRVPIPGAAAADAPEGP